MKKKIILNNLNKTFEEGYEEFISYCKVKNLRPMTIKHYDDLVNYCWYRFYDRTSPIKNIEEKTINDFIEFCKNVRHQKDVTINTNLRGIRTILYYFMDLGYMNKFKITKIKENQECIETYTDEEIRVLLTKPDLKKCSFAHYRNWVICNFLLATGCRESTLISIKCEDIDFDSDLIKYTHTKNRKQQLVPLSRSLKMILLDYIKYIDKNGYLFPNSYGEQLKRVSLSHALIAYNRKLGISKTGVHRWRHTFAKKWILNSGDIFKLQKILGHSDISVVKNYVNMFTNDLKDRFESFNPLDNIKTLDKTYIKINK